ncbi:MAG: cyclase family protein [Pyrinomonadaceae bacterium]|nr:cyclase family protein [Pyrinomonadaceae bacterium]
MILSIETENKTYKIDSEKPLDISIPLEFDALQPNIYGVEKASAKAYQDEHFVGDTRRGGSCNFENLSVNTHCNGTHTECVGHITHQRISIQECLKDAFMLAELITVLPENALKTQDTYSVKLNENDLLITKKSLENSLINQKSKIKNQKSLIIRTLPNSESKKNRDYSVENPPFFSLEAMKFIVEIGVKHLLVDVPSLERLHDEGKLANHRIFWNVEQGSFEINPQTYLNNTVTEMIYVPDKISDGTYLLNLQIAPFVADASPSRPILFEIKHLNE